jgi:hypothetical protein
MCLDSLVRTGIGFPRGGAEPVTRIPRADGSNTNVVKTPDQLDEQDDVLYKWFQETHKGVSTVGEKLASFRSETKANFARVNGRLDRVEGRLDRVEGRLDRVEGRLTNIEVDIAMLKTDVGELKGQMGKLLTHFGLN